MAIMGVGLHHVEALAGAGAAMFRVDHVVAEGKTPIQAWQVVEIPRLGRTLLIEGEIQSAAVDEHIYHEGLVMPAMLHHPAPRRVLVIGGGEGATLREVLRHPSVERAAMVDIDGELVAAAREYLGPWHDGAFDDPRTELIHADARAWVEAWTGEPFDVVISDLSEPVAGGPSVPLWTREFHQAVTRVLATDGVFVCQSGGARLLAPEAFAATLCTLSGIYPSVHGYRVPMTSFLGPWSFCLATHKSDDRGPSVERVAERLAQRGIEPRFWTPRMHLRCFALPPDLRQLLDRHGRVLTDARPFIWPR